MILIVGASGRLGSVVVRHLLAQGKSIRVMTRNPLSLAHLKQQGVEIVSGDLRDRASLASACQGIEQVLAAAHALDGKGDNNPRTVDDMGNRHLIDAAKAAGVKHFIFVSVQGASPDSPLEFFRIKYRTEEYLQASGLSFTILRPGAYMELWAQLIGQPIREQGKTTIFGHGNNPINFVSVEDVARFVTITLDDARARNTVIEVGGPENLTMNQVAEIFERASGRQAKKRHIPLPMMRVMSILMQLINPTMGRLIRNGIFMDTANLRYDMADTARAFGIQLISLEEIAGRATTNGVQLETMSRLK
ncbi:MAG: SDR family oxidoreductase [Chloroflexi bacterium]|nr:MAG: SDR family oxidoreductase [Chloroflexota bacterium]